MFNPVPGTIKVLYCIVKGYVPALLGRKVQVLDKQNTLKVPGSGCEHLHKEG